MTLTRHRLLALTVVLELKMSSGCVVMVVTPPLLLLLLVGVGVVGVFLTVKVRD